MTTRPKAAPEIFQIPLAERPADAIPPGLLPGSPEFEQALIMHYAMQYAARGWQALVTVDREYVRVLAIPQHAARGHAPVRPESRNRQRTGQGIRRGQGHDR